jgi:hypothetical protein
MKCVKRPFAILLTAALFSGLALLGYSPAARAQKKGGGGVIRLEETVIEGRVAKPNAFFINTRQALVYESMELKESFVSEIVDAVKQGPF